MKKHHHIFHGSGPKPLHPHVYKSPTQLAYEAVFVRPAMVMPCPGPATMTPPPTSGN